MWFNIPINFLLYIYNAYFSKINNKKIDFILEMVACKTYQRDNC